MNPTEKIESNESRQDAPELDGQRLEDLFDRVRAFDRPVLSLYANVDPANAESLTRPVSIRLRNTLRDLDGLPHDLEAKVRKYFEERPPIGRSIAVFAGGDAFEVVHLRLPLFGDGGSDRLDARVGEPYFTPLLSAMNAYQPYLVVYAERDQLVLFRIFLGRAQVMWDTMREPTGGEDDQLNQSKNRFSQALGQVRAPEAVSPSTAGNQQNKPKYIADRGDAARQLADEHVDELQAAFYRDAVARLRQLMMDQTIERVIVLGPERDRHRFLSALPGDLATNVCALLAGGDGQVPTPAELTKLVQPAIERIEAERDAQLLDAIDDRGVQGLEPCLRALQEGRLYTLAVPESLEGKVFVDPATNYVSSERSRVAALSQEAVQEVDLAIKLPELAASFGAHLEFVSGEREERVKDQFGGLGGLPRW